MGSSSYSRCSAKSNTTHTYIRPMRVVNKRSDGVSISYRETRLKENIEHTLKFINQNKAKADNAREEKKGVASNRKWSHTGEWKKWETTAWLMKVLKFKKNKKKHQSKKNVLCEFPWYWCSRDFRDLNVFEL